MFRTPSILPWLFPQLIWRIKTTAKDLFLTFDDGPIPGPTEFVLDTLQHFQAKATFFCIGENIQKHPMIFKRIMSENHQVGNHTFHHLKGWGTSTEKYVANVESCAEEIRLNQVFPFSANQSPESKHLFRPPFGRIRSKQLNALKLNHEIIMWDVLTSDYSPSLTPEKCLQGTIKASRSGSIIVFHDSLKAERNMNYALPRFLAHFRNLGYEFKVLPNFRS